MSTQGLINPYPFISGVPQSYPMNNLNLASNFFQFPSNAHPITITGLSSLPFLNTCDLASQLISPVACNFVNDIDMLNGEKIMTDNILSLRIIMSGKEVGSIIGKKGDNIKRFREESMARINISDGNSPERIVTISGNCEQIHHGIRLMCKKLEDDAIKVSEKSSESNLPLLSLRLLIQPVQYTGIIGNGSGRMTQLRETTDATMLFGIDFLPHSSERLLNITGSSDSIVSCIQEICKILIEIPPNAYALPYSPQPLACNGLQPSIVTIGNNKMTSPSFADSMPMPAPSLPLHPIQNIYPQSFYPDQMPYPIGLPISLIPLKIPHSLSPFLNKPPYDSAWKSPNNSVQLQQQNVSREFFVENEMIGCIIGRGGSTINEIRAISGAQIKISNCEDGKQERRINIFGTFEAVQTAQLLINSSLDLYKQNMKVKTMNNTSTILTKKLLPTNYQFSSTIPSNPVSLSQLSFFTFNHNLKTEINISPSNINQGQESKPAFTTMSIASNDQYFNNQHMVKMKPSQVNLDGSKNISLIKFKPY